MLLSMQTKLLCVICNVYSHVTVRQCRWTEPCLLLLFILSLLMFFVCFVLYNNSLEISENNRNKQLNMNFTGKIAISVVFLYSLILFKATAIENAAAVLKFVYKFMNVLLISSLYVFVVIFYLPVHLNSYRFKLIPLFVGIGSSFYFHSHWKERYKRIQNFG